MFASVVPAEVASSGFFAPPADRNNSIAERKDYIDFSQDQVMGSMDAMEEEKQPGEEFSKSNFNYLVEAELCSRCGQTFSAEDERQERKIMIQSTDCFHTIHKKCFIELVYETFPKSRTAPCPKCKQNIMEFEINNYLTDTQKKELEKLE